MAEQLDEWIDDDEHPEVVPKGKQKPRPSLAEAHLVLDAISLSLRHQLSLWDALIVQAAVNAGCTTVLTEDLQDGLEIGTLRIANPFLKTNR